MKNITISELVNKDLPKDKAFEINQDQANYIINNRKPLGVFYLKEKKGDYIGIDNSAGDSFVEEFEDKVTCIAWLTNTNIIYNTELDYGKRVNELVIEERNATTYEVVVKEVLITSVKVNADSEQEAISKAQSMYDKEKIILDWEDIDEVQFRAEKI